MGNSVDSDAPIFKPVSCRCRRRRKVTKFIAQARRSFFERKNLKLHPIELDDIVNQKVLLDVEFRPSFARPNLQSRFLAGQAALCARKLVHEVA